MFTSVYSRPNIQRNIVEKTMRRRCTRRVISTVTVGIDEHRVSIDNTKQGLHSELATIIEPYYKKQRPVIVRGAVSAAPATNLWKSWEYWKETFAGTEGGADDDSPTTTTTTTTTMVAVEMGGSYGSDDSEKAEIPLLAYLQYLELFEERHGRTSEELSHSSWSSIPSEEIVYMAQNDLLDPLYKDIIIPNFCQSNDTNDVGPSSSSGSVGLGRLYSVMIWLGPRASVSPLHFDPLDNCLMQHVGRKRVLLYEPTSSSSSSSMGWHYAGHDGQQNNTSPVNPEMVDEYYGDSTAKTRMKEKYPLFFEESPPCKECILFPGDLLYIPSKWWHHVRSIDTSASVNVWWR
jgi:hypothetical protein